jgi:hypothetical protein
MQAPLFLNPYFVPQLFSTSGATTNGNSNQVGGLNLFDFDLSNTNGLLRTTQPLSNAHFPLVPIIKASQTLLNTNQTE